MTRSILLASLLLVAACSGSADQSDAAPDPVALVSLGPVQQGPVTRTVTVYGTVDAGASGTMALSAPAEATVTRVLSPVGTHVTAGQPVVLLAASPTTRVDLAKAGSDANAAEQALARAQRLRADGLASDAEVEAAGAAARSADALRASLGQRVGALTLRARAAGFVQSIASQPGDLVAAGAGIATIARLGDLRGHFGADPAIARVVRAGTPIRITTGDGAAPIEVSVSSVDPVVDPQTRLAAIYAALPGNAGLAAGEPLSGTVVTGSTGGALTVPYAALLDDGGQPYVYVVAGGVAHRHDVETGATTGDRIAITKGVSPGESVVVKGGTALDDGMKVRTK
ncbi:efflux RND transporter periplasmic adaptor subunit [Sphingomonas koreensis]|nr:efflux RND transporter periplasmic adaptor subunit [Sphingomonas koreensis]